MAGKLTWQTGDRPDEIVIRKSKGKLNIQEIREFMNEREQLFDFGEGALCVIAWRTSGECYTGWELPEAHEGDEASLYVLQDGSECICGRILNLQFCPDCGRPLTEEGKGHV